MTIKHKRFTQCDSTQKFLLSPVGENFNLCSTQQQTAGKGRADHHWEQFTGSLAFSCELTPNSQLTLTALEVGIILCQYLEENIGFTAKLKWPNDILDKNGNKIGGILINNGARLIVGIGLNWCGKHPQYHSIHHQQSLLADKYHSIPKEIYNYLLNNRIDNDQLHTKWNSLCFHLNKVVQITDRDQKVTGTFLGIGTYGEALLENNNTNISCYAGSLIVLE